jgi:hypothetical protein
MRNIIQSSWGNIEPNINQKDYGPKIAKSGKLNYFNKQTNIKRNFLKNAKLIH